MPGRKRSDQLRRMWLGNPKCHWCKRQTVLLPPDGKRKLFPPNAATRDHLRSRFNLGRSEPVRRYPEYRVVLACRECNQRRCREEEVAQPREALWARTGGYPLGHPAKPGRMR